MSTDEAVTALCALIRSELVPPAPVGEETWQMLDRIGSKEQGLSSGEVVLLSLAREIWQASGGVARLGVLDNNTRRAALGVLCSYLLQEPIAL